MFNNDAYSARNSAADVLEMRPLIIKIIWSQLALYNRLYFKLYKISGV